MKSISSWFNSLTTADRHASKSRTPYDPSFTSIRTGLTLDSGSSSRTKGGVYTSFDASPNSSQLNLNTAYQPGLYRRDTALSFAGGNGANTNGAGGGGAAGGVAMQDFTNGVAPPPPVGDSWRRIDRWCEANYPELFDQLSYGATENDVAELEHELEASLPADVRESLYIHDGQERGGRPTGLFFGIALLDCEEIVDEYNLWKKVAAQLPRQMDYPVPSGLSSRQNSTLNINRSETPTGQTNDSPKLGSNGGGGSQEVTPRAAKRGAPTSRQSRQASKPEGAIQLAYSHPGWIPLAKDYNGNNIAVDLSPGPRGRWGQIILFGTDCDVKYVVAQSWASFLALYVSDLESDRVQIEDDGGDGGVRGDMGLMRYVVDADRDYPYMETLKARARRRERAERGWSLPRSNTGNTGTAAHPPQVATNVRPNGKGRTSPAMMPESLPRASFSSSIAAGESAPSSATTAPNNPTSNLKSPKLTGVDEKQEHDDHQQESQLLDVAAPIDGSRPEDTTHAAAAISIATTAATAKSQAPLLDPLESVEKVAVADAPPAVEAK